MNPATPCWPPAPPAQPDWPQPWFAHVAHAGQRALAAVQAGQPLPAALNAAWAAALQAAEPAAGPAAAQAAAVQTAAALTAAPVRFVPQASLPPGQAYEDFIHARREVPTREGWHDFFNALVWQALPHSKLRMNALQAAEIARHGVQARRGPVRDALTLLDENGALLYAPDALWQALAQRRWADLFGPLRPLWAQAALLLPGHAVLEKLLTPYKSITAHVWRVALPFDPQGDLRALDSWLAADLQPAKLATKPFVPLPVLGVPGWWPANQAASFYADAQVFRPLRPRP